MTTIKLSRWLKVFQNATRSEGRVRHNITFSQTTTIFSTKQWLTSYATVNFEVSSILQTLQSCDCSVTFFSTKCKRLFQNNLRFRLLQQIFETGNSLTAHLSYVGEWEASCECVRVCASVCVCVRVCARVCVCVKARQRNFNGYLRIVSFDQGSLSWAFFSHQGRIHPSQGRQK